MQLIRLYYSYLVNKAKRNNCMDVFEFIHHHFSIGGGSESDPDSETGNSPGGNSRGKGNPGDSPSGKSQNPGGSSRISWKAQGNSPNKVGNSPGKSGHSVGDSPGTTSTKTDDGHSSIATRSSKMASSSRDSEGATGGDESESPRGKKAKDDWKELMRMDSEEKQFLIDQYGGSWAAAGGGGMSPDYVAETP